LEEEEEYQGQGGVVEGYPRVEARQEAPEAEVVSQEGLLVEVVEHDDE
jgi:hypothetical protein